MICVGCRVEKPEAAFDMYTTHGRRRRRMRCRECVNLQRRIYRRAHPEKFTTDTWSERHRGAQYKHRYGITLEQYNKSLVAQDHKCGICTTHVSELPTRLYIDHDHKTGQFRGLLCSQCNFALGMLKDRPSLFYNAVAYLEKATLALESRQSTGTPEQRPVLRLMKA